jgi:HlyD family secretion protein
MKKLLILLVLLALAGGAYWWFEVRPEEGPKTELTLYGNVDLRQVNLTFETSERIDRILVEEGDRVDRGQLLAELETDTIALEIERGKAQVAAHEAALARLENGTRPEEIQRARARVAEAAAEAENATLVYERTEELYESRSVARQELDDAEAKLNVALARLERTRDDLQLALEGPRQEDIAEARAMLRAASSELDILEQRYQDSSLFSPAQGTIRNRILEPGDIASPRQTVLTLALTSPKWVRTFVNEPNLGLIRPGMDAGVYVDSHPDRRIPGWIGFISPMAEFTPRTVETREVRTQLVYEVRVFVEDEDNILRLGMPATVVIDLDGSAEGDAGADGGKPSDNEAGSSS